MNWKWVNSHSHSWMGMGIEPFSIREWEWELIHIFWQRMGMGINSSFLVNGPKSGWEHATLFLACLKVFLSYSMHRSSPHFDPLDSSSVDWFHLQKLIPSGPLYHDCISPKLCFLLLSCPCRIIGQAAECKCSYWVYHPLEKPILLLLPLFLCLFFSGLSPYPSAPQIFLMPLLS